MQLPAINWKTQNIDDIIISIVTNYYIAIKSPVVSYDDYWLV